MAFHRLITKDYLLIACSDYIAHLDGVTEIPGGWINHHYIQLGYQLADSVTGFAYSFVGTCIILFIMNLIPGLSLRAPEEDEILGIDDAEIGEFAVSHTSDLLHTIHDLLITILQYDYVEVTRDIVNGVESSDAGSKRTMTPTGEQGTIDTKA
jgi:Amt family ammonium transporter